MWCEVCGLGCEVNSGVWCGMWLGYEMCGSVLWGLWICFVYWFALNGQFEICVIFKYSLAFLASLREIIYGQ